MGHAENSSSSTRHAFQDKYDIRAHDQLQALPRNSSLLYDTRPAALLILVICASFVVANSRITADLPAGWDVGGAPAETGDQAELVGLLARTPAEPSGLLQC